LALYGVSREEAINRAAKKVVGKYGMAAGEEEVGKDEGVPKR
jgi:hypothetical protein